MRSNEIERLISYDHQLKNYNTDMDGLQIVCIDLMRIFLFLSSIPSLEANREDEYNTYIKCQ